MSQVQSQPGVVGTVLPEENISGLGTLRLAGYVDRKGKTVVGYNMTQYRAKKWFFLPEDTCRKMFLGFGKKGQMLVKRLDRVKQIVASGQKLDWGKHTDWKTVIAMDESRCTVEDSHTVAEFSGNKMSIDLTDADAIKAAYAMLMAKSKPEPQPKTETEADSVFNSDLAGFIAH